MSTSYTPVPYDFREMIEADINAVKAGKIFFFKSERVVDEAEGRIVSLEEVPGEGLFVLLEPSARIRIDRIITLFGKPGAAYDEYDAYGRSCMDCHGGYDF